MRTANKGKSSITARKKSAESTPMSIMGLIDNVDAPPTSMSPAPNNNASAPAVKVEDSSLKVKSIHAKPTMIDLPPFL